jgi:hypothetical protein
MAPVPHPTNGSKAQIVGSASATTVAAFADIAFFAPVFLAAAFLEMAPLPEDCDLPALRPVAASAVPVLALSIK